MNNQLQSIKKNVFKPHTAAEALLQFPTVAVMVVVGLSGVVTPVVIVSYLSVHQCLYVWELNCQPPHTPPVGYL